MKISFLFISMLLVLGCASKKAKDFSSQSFDLSIENLGVEDSLSKYCVKISSIDTAMKIRRAYTHCPKEHHTEINDTTYRIKNCEKQLYVKDNIVEIWFRVTNDQDSFLMSNIAMVCAKNGKISVEEMNLNLTLR